MLDPQLLRKELESVIAQLERRGAVEFDRKAYQQAEARRKRVQVEIEALQNQSKTNAKRVGEAKAAGGDTGALLKAGEDLKQEIALLEKDLRDVQDDLRHLLEVVPNLPESTVPDGKDENDNVERRRWGEPPQFSFAVKDHVALGESLGLMDNEAAVKLAGGRFAVLFGDLAKLQRALIRFMLDLHTQQHGYREVYVPYIANTRCLTGTGQLPKFQDDLFALSKASTQSSEELTSPYFYYLIPTAEVPLTNLCRDRILEEDELPLKWVTHTPCFRSEAGSYGQDTRGLIRQHQFEKVEMVQVVQAAGSADALEALTGHAEVVLQALELPYRVVELCAGDLGFAAARTYDLEVWLPGQQRYREISSCSNMTDFQARRMKARVRRGQAKPELVHTLNGSGLAVGRTLVAILENFQDEKGRVRIPSALIPYMDGQEVIEHSA